MSIRVIDADGHTRDLVGVLSGPTTVVRRDGSAVDFDTAAITHWRLVPKRAARAGTGAPLSIRVRELEDAAAATWPAEVSKVSGGWLLRASGGVTMRANSALPLSAQLESTGSVDSAIMTVVDFSRAAVIIPAIHVPLPTHEGLDRLLGTRGWGIASEGHMLVQDTRGIDPPVASVDIRHDDRPLDDWRSVQGPDGAVDIMNRYPADYVSIWHGRPVGAGRIAFADGWGIVSRVFVAAPHRGTGIGTAILQALAASARDAGVDQVALEVDADNSEALRLCARLGFRRHHRYRHWILSEPGKDAL